MFGMIFTFVAGGVGPSALDAVIPSIAAWVMHTVFASVEELRAAFVREHERIIAASVARGERVSLALTGGSTADQLYPALSKAAVPWSMVDVFFGDERCVPASDAHSNQRQARALLLDHVAARVYAVDGTLDPAAAATRYAAQVPPSLDIVHAGIGPDGHLCSLFPGHSVWTTESSLHVAEILDSPKPPSARITLTKHALQQAKHVFLVACGPGKADVVKQILVDKDPALPATVIASLAHARVWMDADAARHMSRL
jgi:6-phosphogluconolactonase